MQKTENKPLYYTNTRIKSKWIKGLSVTLETIKLLKKTQAVKSQAFLVAIFFSDISPWARKTNKKKNKQVILH